MFKKGPEIKLPDLKVPDALLDLYYDLRVRHLLPLVAVLLAAIVAVPIALTQSSGSGSSAAIPTPSAVANRQGELVVTKAAPGLRSYRRRLNYLRAKDPFVQQFAKPESEEAGEGTSTASTTSGESGASSPSSETSSSGTTTPGTESGSTTGTSHHVTYFSYAIDVRVVSGGAHKNGEATGKSKPQVRHNLPELTMLPNRKTPAAIFMGVSKDGKKALLLLSSNVEAVFGDGICVLGSKTCQLLALEPGIPETFVYGAQGRTFRIELLKIHFVASKKPNRAPLGNPKHKH